MLGTSDGSTILYSDPEFFLPYLLRFSSSLDPVGFTIFFERLLFLYCCEYEVDIWETFAARRRGRGGRDGEETDDVSDGGGGGGR